MKILLLPCSWKKQCQSKQEATRNFGEKLRSVNVAIRMLNVGAVTSTCRRTLEPPENQTGPKSVVQPREARRTCDLLPKRELKYLRFVVVCAGPPIHLTNDQVNCSCSAVNTTLLFLVTLGWPSTASADEQCPPRQPPSSNLSAVCTLNIVGKGRETAGLQRLLLQCNSTTGEKVPVGIASARQNAPLSRLAASVRQQLEQQGSGITIVEPPCQQQTEAPGAGDNLLPMFGLLYFCEGAVTIMNPVVRDLFLPYASSNRAQDDVAPVIVGGTARVSVVGARVDRVVASTTVGVVQDAELSLLNCAFNDTVGNPGSAVFARDASLLRIASSNFSNGYSTDFGGALAIMGCCDATVQDSVFFKCRADMSGGALFISELASVVVSNTRILRSTAGNGRTLQSQGGGIFCEGRYLGLVNGTRIMYNRAHGSGGGLYAVGPLPPTDRIQSGEGTAQVAPKLQLVVSPDTILSRNEAVGSDAAGPSTGGGAFLGPATVFDPSVVRAVARNNTAPRDAEVGTQPERLSVLPDRVVGYVARPDALEGGLRVEVVLLGEEGFPCGGRNIRAYWDSIAANAVGASGGQSANGTLAQLRPPATSGPPKHTAATNASGVAVMWLRFFEPPGQHIVAFLVEGLPSLAANLTVEVQQCWKGEQEERPGVCRVCPAGSYNFEPGRCEGCPARAECAGGSAVLSQPGFWLSSPQYNIVHRWVCVMSH